MDTSLNNKTILDNIQNDVFKILKPDGFKKKSRTFNRETEQGVYQVINFQAGQFPLGDNYEIPGYRLNFYGKFTINLGICIAELYKISFPTRPKTFFQEYDCQIRERLGIIIKGYDFWWDITDNIEEIAREIITQLDKAKDWFYLFSTRENICNNWTKINLPAAKMYAAIITMKVDKKKGEQMLQEYYDDIEPTKQGHKDHVSNLAKSLGLTIKTSS